MESSYYSLKGQNMILKDSILILNLQLAEMEVKVDEMTQKITTLQQDTLNKSAQVRMLLRENAELQNTVQLLSHNISKEIESKTQQINELQKKLNEREKGLELLAAELEIQQQRLYESSKALNEKEKQLNLLSEKLSNLENILNSYQKNMENLKTKVSDALLGFENSGLSVHIKNGKVYVSLEENLLFQTGSTKIDKKGQAALIKLAKLLEENPEINIMIEGHTDNIPYVSTSGCIKNNWQLSVLRAVSVTEILLENNKIDPKRIIPCGRADSYPLSTENTKEGRAKNRRTEIILTPRLDELFHIINTN